MALEYNYLPQFSSGDKVISLVYHPPEVKPGTNAIIVLPWFGTLCAVQLPNGELHRWFAWFELEALQQTPNSSGNFFPGELAKVISTVGHPPEIKIGTVVRIVKCISQIYFYDLMLNDSKYHRWLAEFELAPPIAEHY